MNYIVIDGDDVGQMISACYFNNNVSKLSEVNALIESRVNEIAAMLKQEGFKIIFCAADGVAAQSKVADLNVHNLYLRLAEIGGYEITFSAGLGENLREAYVALLAAKSNGKARLVNFQELR